MKKKFSFLSFPSLIASLLISACTPLYYLPYYDKVKEMEEMPVEEGKFDCVDKSLLYHKYLDGKNIESRIVSGRVKGLPDGEIHAWVEVYNHEFNEWYIVDPTLFGADDSNDGLRVSYPKKDRIKWIEYSENIAPEDIRLHNKEKLAKIYWNKIPREYRGNFR